MRVDRILEHYAPGDENSWADEFTYLLTFYGEEMGYLAGDINENGIKEPILLGDDGRVWDGHHRLLVARLLGIEEVDIEKGHTLKGKNP